MLKIVFFGLAKKDQKNFEGAFGDSEVLFLDEKMSPANAALAKDAEVVSVFVDSGVSKEAIDQMPNLKFIAARSTGYNNIDCEYARQKGIKVANVPAYGSNTVAEFTFGLILCLSRKMVGANGYIRESSDFNYFPFMEGVDLYGKTLGVIGTGKIGKNVIKIAKGFGMNIKAYDLFPDASFEKEMGYKDESLYGSLEEVLSGSDIVTLHAPYTKENHHLINKENIALMKKGSYIVNTARGELIDTEALFLGLKSGAIGGAGLDVLEEEPDLKGEKKGEIAKINLELMKMPNVVITPHMAFYTREAVDEILRVTRENIEGFLRGDLKNIVN